MVKQWLIWRTQTEGPELRDLRVEILEKDLDMPISEAEQKGKRINIKIKCANHVNAMNLSDILSMGLSRIEVIE